MNLQFADHWLRLTHDDGHQSVYPALWLYDNHPEHRDPRTRQRLIDITDLPADPRIASAELRPDAVHIGWSGESKFSSFPIPWLRANCLCSDHARPAAPAVSLWGCAQAANLCWMDHAAVAAGRAPRRDWLRAIARDGLAFLKDVPVKNGYVLEFAAMLGYITETNYGRLFEVRAVDNPNNLAYSPISLGVHTDNPYRNPVPGFQVLHCLEPSAEGGESIFVDGFRVAQELKAEDPDAFRLLASTPVTFTFRDEDAELTAERPILQLGYRGELEAIHYNNRALAPLRIPANQLPEFYRAYRAFARLLRDPRFELHRKLEAGELVVFDNHRILHGRAAFRGARLLEGCYINRDSLFSNLAVLERNGAA